MTFFCRIHERCCARADRRREMSLLPPLKLPSPVHLFYNNSTEVVLSIYARNVSAESVNIEFGETGVGSTYYFWNCLIFTSRLYPLIQYLISAEHIY